MDKGELTALIRAKAFELDFDICGIAKPRRLDERAEILRKWCDAGMHDNMGYLERNIDNRADPEAIFPGARSIIVTGFSYNSEIKQKDQEAPVLSRYTYGRDYHNVISDKLEQLLGFVKTTVPGASGKIFVDSGQLFEKAWAQEAGLGWQGLHSILISREIGSFFFIGILILDIELEPDTPFTENHCGKCRLCMDACPTGAINGDRTIDARKCISNLTIENRGPIPEEFVPKLVGRVYACDRCQEVCPWNKDVASGKHPEFELDSRVADLTLADWKSLTEEQFIGLFSETSMKRIKYSELVRNINAAIRSMDN
jgi:epoxyqueuosine reductase